MKSIVTQLCLHCNSSFETRTVDIKRGYGKFCSRTCSIVYRKQNYTAKQANTECALCKHPMYRKQSQQMASKSGLQFCSRECKEKAQTIGTEHSIDDLHLPHYGKTESRHHYRSRALKEYGESCQRCGYSKYPDILHVHHKDRDRKNGALDNLEVLCPTCHYENHFLAKDGWFRV